MLAILNDKSRVYGIEGNFGYTMFYFRADTESVSRALRHFAKDGGREVFLYPGPCTLATFQKKQIPFNLSVENQSLRTGKKAALCIYLDSARPAGPADPAQVRRWIADLDNDRYAVRARAHQGLSKLGQTVEAALREALTKKPSTETRRGIESLLKKMEGVNLDLLRIPEGVTVLGIDDQRACYLDEMKSLDPIKRGMAATALAGLETRTKDVVSILLELLRKDKHEYVRRSVASALARLGRNAKPALPAMRKMLRDPDPNIRNAFQQAVAMIEKAKENPREEELAKLQEAICKDIDRYLKAARASKK
jgi:hypothetical protein